MLPRPSMQLKMGWLGAYDASSNWQVYWRTVDIFIAFYDGHAFFGLSDGYVIDSSRGGNNARWFNHVCAVNCEAAEDEGDVFIEAVRDIEVGDERFIECLVAVDDPFDERVRQQYACPCGATTCRQSVLAAAGWARYPTSSYVSTDAPGPKTGSTDKRQCGSNQVFQRDVPWPSLAA